VNQPVPARDLAIVDPSLPPDSPAEEAARLLADRVPACGLAVQVRPEAWSTPVSCAHHRPTGEVG
jgi:hypothetical protein